MSMEKPVLWGHCPRDAGVGTTLSASVGPVAAHTPSHAEGSGARVCSRGSRVLTQRFSPRGSFARSLTVGRRLKGFLTDPRMMCPLSPSPRSPGLQRTSQCPAGSRHVGVGLWAGSRVLSCKDTQAPAMSRGPWQTLVRAEAGSPGLVPPPPASGRVGLGASSHREMVSSTRLPTWALDQGSLPASGTVGVGADCRAGWSGSRCHPRGPLPAAAGPPGAPRPLRWRRVPCPGSGW